MKQISRGPILERAYQIARSGKVRDLRALRQVLTQESYSAEEIRITFLGVSLRAAMKKLCSENYPGPKR